jgi:hypothetical protein
VARENRKKKVFFLKKRNQKTCVTSSTLPATAPAKVQKFFASFFQKRRPSFRKPITRGG